VRNAGGWLYCAVLSLPGLFPAGCSHPCGYADIRSVITRVDGNEKVTEAEAAEPLRVARDVSENNAVLDVRVESIEVVTASARRDRYGREVYVPWTWDWAGTCWSPFLKLGVDIFIIPPFYLAAHDPHAHGGEVWRRRDYWRDVVAWWNFFSTIPTGPREIAATETLIGSENMEAIVNERRKPIAGRTISLSLDGREILSGVSNADGSVAFDLGPFLKPNIAGAGHSLRVSSLAPNLEEVSLSWTLDAKIVRKYLDKQRTTP
jgi:hypothetical protein